MLDYIGILLKLVILMLLIMLLKNFHYFVEGQCEEKLINTLKGKYVKSAKVTILNVLQK